MSFSRAQQIQACYPDHEPDWAAEENAVLIELVARYIKEPSCAGSALCELSIFALRELCGRAHESIGDLSVALLSVTDADKWLKLEAFRSLPSTHMAQGFEAARSLVDSCPVVVLEMLAAAMHDHLQGQLPDALRNHDVAKKLGNGRYWGNGSVFHFAGSLMRDEYLQAEQLMFGKAISAWGVALLLAVWALGAGVLSLMNHVTIPAVMILLLGLVLGVIAYVMKIKDVAWDNNPDFRKHYYGTISAEGIETHGENSWRFDAWPEMTGWAASDDMLVVLSPGGAHAFPVSRFSSWTEWERARALCAAKLPQAAADK